MAKNTDESRPKISKEGLVKSLEIFKYIRPYLGYFIIGMILLVLGTLLFMLVPGICGELVDVATGESELNYSLNQLGLFLIVIVLGQAIISFFRTVTFAIVSEKGMADVRKALYAKLVTQPVHFFESTRVGDITSRITADVEQLQSAISITLAEFIRQIVILIVGIIYLAYLAPKLSLVMLLTLPVVIVMAMLFGRYVKKLSRKRQDYIADSNTIVEESMQNFSIVKSFTNERFELNRYAKQTDSVVSISLKYARARGLFFGFIISLLFGCILFILWRGAIHVQQGEMDSGDLVSFVLYTMVLGSAIAGLGSMYTSLAGAIGATERVQEIMQSQPELDIHDQKDDFKKFDGKIDFNHIEFSYPSRPNVKVLKDINIPIVHGQKVALVGQSGAGKSTIVQLLMGFYQAQSGQILIDGQDIKEMDLRDLRANIGIVPQDVLMFGGTIKENILYGRHSATDEEVNVAARQANCYEFINQFPDGFDTIVGERGIKLSGGQKQRIAIARAILKNPTILILDEATSSLDAESEKLVQEALGRLMENRTSIIIAHRLSTIREVDCIYVLDDGQIVESGDHDSLFNNQDGIYKQLAMLQLDPENA